MESESKSEVTFRQRYLPWVVAGAALVVYLFTLANGLTFLGLGAALRATGWAWQPQMTNPLSYLVTWPIHLLPVNWQVTGLNALAAVFSALTLALLARSVVLLPHDRTKDQRQFEHNENGILSIKAAWIPPLLAVIVCGLQQTFWEHAVIGTGEALDLLVFAYIIRCLLEYRVDQRESWLSKLAIVYGLGITNNFALIGFFPAALGAIIWIKGKSFFDLRFCLRMALLGLAGLSLYLLIPLIQLSNQNVNLSFWDMLRLDWSFQKSMLLKFPRFMLLVIGLSSLAPVLFMGIKWPASFGDISTVGNFLTNLMTHVLHAVFLAACVYVAFDPELSPRNMVGPYGYQMLPFYYLGALSVGYFSGYFLLVFGSAPLRAWQRPSPLRRLLNQSVVGIVWLALLGLPAGLVLRNLPQVQATSAGYLATYGNQVAQQLKSAAPQGALIISDDSFRLYAAYKALKEQKTDDKYLLLDSASLPYASYHRYLHRTHPKYWPEIATNIPPNAIVEPLMLVELMTHLSKTNALFYLHPSFGYYFEKFYATPNNLLYELKPYPSNEVEIATLTDTVVRQNDQFWKEFQQGPLKQIAAGVKAGAKRSEVNQSLALTGTLYARNLDWFGVQLQKAGQLDKAGEYFSSALEINPENASARVNLEFNKALRGGNAKVILSQAAQKTLAPYGDDLESLMKFNGPVDEPSMCYRAAQIFAGGNNFRQAAQFLQRTLKFDAQNLPARLGLASIFNQIRQPDLALQLIAGIRAGATTNPLAVPAQMDLLQTEANAYASKNEFPAAEKVLTKAIQDYPANAEPHAFLANLYLSRNDLTNALKVFENEMKIQADEPSAYINYARLLMLNNQFAAAIPLLDKALQLRSRDPDALLNRAIANMKAGNLDAAERDYRDLYNLLPKKVYAVIYGLHEVFWQKKDMKQATKWAKEFLAVVPPTSPDAKVVTERLKRLKSGSF